VYLPTCNVLLDNYNNYHNKRIIQNKTLHGHMECALKLAKYYIFFKRHHIYPTSCTRNILRSHGCMICVNIVTETLNTVLNMINVRLI